MHKWFLAGAAALAVLTACSQSRTSQGAGAHGPGTGTAPIAGAPRDPQVATELTRQRAFVIATNLRNHARVVRIADSLMFSGASLCGGKVTRRIGVRLLHAVGGEPHDRLAWRELGHTGDVQLGIVGRGTPAERAGLRELDIVTEIDGVAVGPELGSGADADNRLGLGAERGGPIRIKVRRGGQVIAAAITPVLACAFDADTTGDSRFNAYADGNKIVITRGLAAALTDDELAFVIGHELAHNALGHVAGTRAARAAGGEALQAYRIEAELAADRLGVQFMRAGGYNPAAAIVAIRKIAVDNPMSLVLRTTHPTTPERAVALEQAIRGGARR